MDEALWHELGRPAARIHAGDAPPGDAIHHSSEALAFSRAIAAIDAGQGEMGSLAVVLEQHDALQSICEERLVDLRHARRHACRCALQATAEESMVRPTAYAMGLIPRLDKKYHEMGDVELAIERASAAPQHPSLQPSPRHRTLKPPSVPALRRRSNPLLSQWP